MRKRTLSIGCLLISVAMLLTSCNQANRSSIFRTFTLDDEGSIAIDAHQRAIISSRKIDGKGRRIIIYCAEPSPDAFSSITSALALKIGKQDSSENNGLAIERGLKQMASAALSTRNATIQLLRDGLYRACEAYAAGALTDNEYLRALQQYQDMILALLSIELLSDMGEKKAHPMSVDKISDISKALVERVLEGGSENTHQARVSECQGLLVTMHERREIRREAGEKIDYEGVSAIEKLCADLLSNQSRDEDKDLAQNDPDTETTFADSILSLLGATSQAAEFIESRSHRVPPQDDQRGSIEVGRSVDTTFQREDDEPQWFKVTIADGGRFEILATAPSFLEADPAMKLYEKADGTEDLKEIGEDDDGGGEYNAKLEIPLDAGEYWLRLFDVSGRGGRVEIRVNPAQ